MSTDSMIPTPHVRLIAAMGLVGLCTTIVGCGGNLGAAKEQVRPCLPEEYKYSASPQKVWLAVSEIVNRESHRHFLVNDTNSHIISWIEQLDADTQEHMYKDKGRRAKRTRDPEVKEVGEKGIAVSTIFVRPIGEGTLVRFRRVYYGPLTQPRFVHSRGDFSHALHTELEQMLLNEEQFNGEEGI